MDVQNCILSRRSIRKYTNQEIDQSTTEQLLIAAMHAPSARNQQAWHFIVIEKRNQLDALADAHPYAKMLKSAPLAIAVCADLSMEKSKDMWVQDCAAATQNILLRAHSLSLGAVWLGVFPREERIMSIGSVLELPDHIVPISLISIGHPDESPEPTDRFCTDRIHYNSW